MAWSDKAHYCIFWHRAAVTKSSLRNNTQAKQTRVVSVRRTERGHMTLLHANKKAFGGGWKLLHSCVLAAVSSLNSTGVFSAQVFLFFRKSHPPRQSPVSFQEFWERATCLNHWTNERNNCGSFCIMSLSVMCLVTPCDSSNSRLMPALICCLVGLDSRINGWCCSQRESSKTSHYFPYFFRFCCLGFLKRCNFLSH